MNGDYIYIVYNSEYKTIESVWTTKELAEAARFYHALDSKDNDWTKYSVIPREVNKAKCHD